VKIQDGSSQSLRSVPVRAEEFLTTIARMITIYGVRWRSSS